MRILTVAQPWAECIVFHGKNVENRTRNIAGNYRGVVAIHAGLRFDEGARVDLRAAVDLRPRAELARGAIIGVVELTAVHTVDEVGCMAATPDCSPWAEKVPGTFHLRLANPRPIADAIPYRGALGLRGLDDVTTAAVLEGLA